MIRFSTLLILLLPLVASATTAGAFFDLGRGRYERGDYQVAVEYLEHSIELEPGQSDYYLWLGMAYGRLAEKLSWLQALDYAEKSGQSLRKAVDLDDHNIRALLTLAEFYKQAPAFLGGNVDKAAQLQAKALKLQSQ